MFAYPSGSGLHMGHAWNYVLGDILSRFKILNGFEVMHPVGYDSLGLPAENAAIKDGTHPRDYTDNSIKSFMNQQKKLGLTYDWSRMFSTAHPSYYKWDQWIFLKMLEKGLAYQKESNVNWCPSCATVLANEQSQNGNCDRCDTGVEIKRLTQWFLKITNYADELYEELDKLKDWPERTKTMQRNWIGKSNGTEIDFLINNELWPVFTTRADTIYGVTFVVISAQHKKLMNITTDEQREEVLEFVKGQKSVSEKEMANMEKEGVFTGAYAINPINNEKIPVYAGNFVVADYGSGMVMAVPAHDKRDFDFAKKYGIEIREVISPKDSFSGENDLDFSTGDFHMSPNLEEAYIKKGILRSSEDFNWMDSDDAKVEITKYLKIKGLGRSVTNFRLRDWGISRQRYWGTPIPIIHCEDCGAVPVPVKDLPVILPKDVKFGEGNPLETNEEWLKVNCPKCGKIGRREADTMDTFTNSSWYFMRFCDSNNEDIIFDSKKVNDWCPIDTYIGGAEHACMHLIYSRFYTKFLRYLGLIDFDEPAKRLFHQGMIMGEDGEKMSKSKGNAIEPIAIIEKYGVDALRFFLVSMASPDKDFDWSEKGIVGAQRFINKIFEFVEISDFKKDSEELERKLNNTIKNIEKYYDNFEYRKATIELRSLFDLILEYGSSKEVLEKFLKILSPIMPHITEELWEKLGNKEFISTSSWPKYDKNKLKVKKKEINLDKKIIDLATVTILKLKEKDKDISKVYIYAVPFEVDKIDSEKISSELGKEVIVYSVRDASKYDPENKSKKSRPGLPGFYFE